MAKNVVFDTGSAERIASAVKWVEQFSFDETSDQNTGPDLSTEFATPMIVAGTFYGVWELNDTSTVTWESTGGTLTLGATNYLATVGEEGNTTNCVIGIFEKTQSEYVLISTLSSKQTTIRGQFTGEWPIQTGAAVSYVADDGSTATQQAHNYFATVGAEGETNNCCIIQAGSEWILIAAQCEEIPPLENEVD